MNTTCEEWCVLVCGECKWFNVRADLDGVDSTCKRLDHKHLRFAKKTFKCYDCGTNQPSICADFAPRDSAKWLKQHWEEVQRQIIPYKDGDIIFLNVDGDTQTRWAVKATEFYNNTFLNEDGTLRWVYKYYYVKSRESAIGYKVVYELPDGTKLNCRPIL